VPYTATMVGFAVGGVLMGRVADRFGIRLPLIFGTVMLAVGFLVAALAGAYWQFVLAQALLIGMLGSSVTFGPLVADVSLWFRRQRGIAVAIVASGNYFAGAIWPSILQPAIHAFGWRHAYMGVGAFCLVTMLPLAMLLRSRAVIDDSLGVRAGGTHRSADVPLASLRPPLSPGQLQALLMVAGLACCIAMSMPQVHIIAYCGDLGYGPARGAEMLALMLAFGAVSRLGSGLIADHIGGVGTLMLGSALQGLALLFYLPFNGLTSKVSMVSSSDFISGPVADTIMRFLGSSTRRMLFSGASGSRIFAIWDGAMCSRRTTVTPEPGGSSPWLARLRDLPEALRAFAAGRMR